MKIAQIAPMFERVPPRTYGGTERVVSYLTEALIQQGHEVTLFASGDSITQARLVTAMEHSTRHDYRTGEWAMYHAIQLDQVREMAHQFDILHFHTGFMHFPLAPLLGVPQITTMHGRLDIPELATLLGHFTNCPLVSISDSQRRPVPNANWCATVHHGLPRDLYSFHPEAEDYFVFIGRISPEKRLDRAIEIAIASGTPLYIGAKIDAADEAYFTAQIKSLLQHPLVHFIGEIGEQEKRRLLGHARALLFPIDWPEPFGLVVIEALACGTPVIAYPHGAVPELIKHGETGFLVSNQQDAVQAARQIGKIDRRACREAFERRFTAARMAENYVAAYRKLQLR